MEERLEEWYWGDEPPYTLLWVQEEVPGGRGGASSIWQAKLADV